MTQVTPTAVATVLAVPRVAVSIDARDLRQRVETALRDSDAVRLVERLADADVIVGDTFAAFGLPVIVIGSPQQIADALAQGGAGGLRPGFTAAQLVAAVAAVALGLTCSERAPMPTPRDKFDGVASHPLADENDVAFGALTDRETQVLELLKTGASNKHIARALDISVHTAKFHVASVIAKLGATGRTDAVARAFRATQTLL